MEAKTSARSGVRGRILPFALLAALALAIAPLLGAAQEGATVQWSDHDEFGQILVDGEGMTLYIFTEDGPNESNCTDDCLDAWPPLISEAEPMAGEGVTGTLDTIERDDTGDQQVTLDGQPLYYWAGDQAPGDTDGHGVGDVWFVIQADEPEPVDEPADDDPAAPDDDEPVEPAPTGSGGLLGGSSGPATGLVLMLAAGVAAATLAARRLAARR